MVSAEQVVNEASVETTWAASAFAFAERHWLLLQQLQKSFRMTPVDDEIYAAFRREFPDMNVSLVDQELMKSDEGKAQWRAFLEGAVKDSVNDFGFGTLLRVDHAKPYGPENTTLVARGAFYAIEIARIKELPAVPMEQA